eukprot:955582-Pelagomonas_calceolata.AAC.1
MAIAKCCYAAPCASTQLLQEQSINPVGRTSVHTLLWVYGVSVAESRIACTLMGRDAAKEGGWGF